MVFKRGVCLVKERREEGERWEDREVEGDGEEERGRRERERTLGEKERERERTQNFITQGLRF